MVTGLRDLFLLCSPQTCDNRLLNQTHARGKILGAGSLGAGRVSVFASWGALRSGIVNCESHAFGA